MIVQEAITKGKNLQKEAVLSAKEEILKQKPTLRESLKIAERKFSAVSSV